MYKNTSYSLTIFLLFLFSVSLASSKQLSLAKLLTPLHLSRSPQTQFLSLNSKNLRSNYAIDDVLTMMKELLNKTQTEIDTLNSDWAASKDQKDVNINDFLTSLNSQAAICSEISGRLNEANETATDLNDTISEYTQKILENQQKIENLLQQRCDANSQYIDSLKNNKQLLALIEILREAVQQFNQSFVQKKQFDLVHSKLIVFLNRYTLRKKARMSFLQNKQDVPDVQERTGFFLFLIIFCFFFRFEIFGIFFFFWLDFLEEKNILYWILLFVFCMVLGIINFYCYFEYIFINGLSLFILFSINLLNPYVYFYSCYFYFQYIFYCIYDSQSLNIK